MSEKKINNTEEQVRTIIAKKLSKKIEEVTLDSRLVEDLGADSLDVVELLMMLEDEYNITIQDEDAVKLNTIKDIIAFLDSNKK